MNNINIKNKGGSWFTGDKAINFLGSFNISSTYNALGFRLCGVLW